jgi:hypothetical protein
MLRSPQNQSFAVVRIADVEAEPDGRDPAASGYNADDRAIHADVPDFARRQRQTVHLDRPVTNRQFRTAPRSSRKQVYESEQADGGKASETIKDGVLMLGFQQIAQRQQQQKSEQGKRFELQRILNSRAAAQTGLRIGHGASPFLDKLSLLSYSECAETFVFLTRID